MSKRSRGAASTYPIKLFYTSNMPIILQASPGLLGGGDGESPSRRPGCFKHCIAMCLLLPAVHSLGRRMHQR